MSDRSEATKGLLGHIQNLHFTSILGVSRVRCDARVVGEFKNLRFTIVLSVRHVRSDERVARRSEKFAFYHIFERPIRPKGRKGRAASSKIYILPQF